MFRSARFLAASALAAALASGGLAHAQDEVQLIQPGDSVMSCKALAAEINALSSAQAKAAKRAESGKKFLGFASTALQVAGPMLSGGMGKLGGDGGMGAMMAQQAMGQMQAQAMQQQVGMGLTGPMGGGYGAEPPADADNSVQGQRVARLNGLHAQKGC